MQSLWFLFAVLVSSSVFAQDQGMAWSADEISFLRSWFDDVSRGEIRKITFKPMVDAELKQKFSGWTEPHSRTLQINQESFDSGIRIHEAIHQILYRRKPNEQKWSHEGLALLLEFQFDLKRYGKEATFRSFFPIVSAFRELQQKEPISQTSLKAFQMTAEDYGKCFLYFLYLYENFGEEKFVQDFLVSDSGKFSTKQYFEPFLQSLHRNDNTLATKAHDPFSQFLRLTE